MTYRETLEQLANEWIASGRDKSKLLTNGPFVRARLWSWTPGAKKEGYSDNVKELIAASLVVFGENTWDNLFGDRDYCSSCGTSFSDANLSRCTNCSSYICYQCVRNWGSHPNGNNKHHCGGEIVG